MRILENKIIVFFTLISFSIAGQDVRQGGTIDKDLHFHLINVSSGLSNNVINAIAQDSLGYLWIGTEDGMNRFDGTNFKVIKKNLKKKGEGLANNFVQSLLLRDGNELLIGTDGGLNIYNLRHDKMALIDYSDGLLDNSISGLYLTDKKQVITTTYRGGIQFLDATGHFAQKSSLINRDISSNEISSISMQGDSVLWLGTFGYGLNKIDFRNKVVTNTLNKENSFLPSSAINSLFTDSDHNVWIGTRHGIGIITAAGDSIVLRKANLSTKGLSDEDVLCFREDNNKRMWIGTRNGGLNILDMEVLKAPEHPIQNTWFLPENDGTSVYNRTVSSIFMDRSYKMWIGTPTGLNYVDPKGEPVHIIRQNETLPESVSHNRIGALAGTDTENIWIGTDGGGLDLFDPVTRKYIHYKHQDDHASSLSNNYVISVLQDSKKRVWAGTYRGGINLMLPGRKGFTHFLQGKPENGSDVRVLFESSDHTIWAGTNQGGLFRYDERLRDFRYIESLRRIDIRNITEDHTGRLWLATFGSGIIAYDPDTDTSEYFYSGNVDNLPSNIFFCILVLNEEEILAGSRYGGLVRLNTKTKSLLNITEADGLSNNSVTAIIRENNHYIWLSTFNGINRYDLRTNEVLNISALDNIDEGGFNVGAITRSPGGTIYVGGNNGINYFNPSVFPGLEQEYPLFFEELRILNKKVNVTDQKKSILRQSLTFQDHLTLNYDQNTFSVDFVALKYPVSSNITYSYKLKNYNNFWINTRELGTANFTDVAPGDYELQVRVNHPYTSRKAKKLYITIVPPFWKTWPAYLLYIVIAGLLIWISIRYYTERLKLKSSLVLEKRQRQLENDLNEERLRFFTGFSHELKTPLTLIMAPVEQLIEKVKQKELLDHLHFIKRNAQTLHHSINRLLEFRKTEEGLSQLTIGQYDMGEKIAQWTENYRLLAKDKNIRLYISVSEKNELLRCDIEKIEVIFNNLLSNALKHAVRKGIVNIAMFRDNHMLCIQVSNTGSGINEEEIDHIFSWYYRAGNSVSKSGSGIGLALSKRFAELHHGHISVSSKKDGLTRFTLSLPTDVHFENYSELRADTLPQKPSMGEVYAEHTETPAKGEKIIRSSKDRDLILLIDDNPEILKFLDGLLKSEFDLIHAFDGDEGIVKALQYIPNLIISDIMMPVKDGIDLCSTLKNHIATSHIPVILLTAKSNTESMNTGFEEGADAYMTKPFNPVILKTRIKNLLANRIKLRNFFLNQTGQDQVPAATGNQSGILRREKDFLQKMEELILKQSEKGAVNTVSLISEIGMSRTSLYRKLKALTGLNINEFIRDVKLKKAADLIRNENYSVNEASYEVGFNSVKYFRKIFKEKYGMTPVDYRSQPPRS